MSSIISELFLLTLQILVCVQSKEYPAKQLVQDRFEAVKNNGFTRLHLEPQQHNRFRRSVGTQDKSSLLNKRRYTRDNKCTVVPTSLLDHKIVTDKYTFPSDDKHLSFSIAWVGKNYQTILLLATTEFLIFSIQRSALYKSTDMGRTFVEINQNIYGGNIKKNNGIQRSPVDPDLVILVSHTIPIIGFSILYITKDGTKTWKKVQTPFQVSGALEFHPRQKDWIIAKDASFSRGAYLSTDFGYTWKKLRPYVISVKWGARQDMYVGKEEETILLTQAPLVGRRVNIYNLSLWRSRNLGKNFKLIVKHVYSFGVQGPFLFLSVDLNKNNKTRIMQVSTDGGDKLAKVQVPFIKPDQFYSILDMSEGMVFLHVDEEGDTGKGIIYTSDADGIVFDKSLENHVYTNYEGVTDFYKVESMNGTYIASQMNSDKSISTVISFDRGGEWNPIKLPESYCKGMTALKSVPCSLHIHNLFSMSRGVNVSMPPLSDANAVGIIIAHGNAGYNLLSKTIFIWISRDGGYTWTQTSLEFSNHYAIADHGSLLLAIPSGPKKVGTLKYSVDEGACWFDYQFTEKPFQLTGMVTSPGAKTMMVNLWGYTDKNRKWMVYTVNFHKLLRKKCLYNSDASKSDYEEWQPHANGKNKGCLLGKKVTILRPKPDVLCFNGEDYVPKATVEHCLCTEADLECDYGYYRGVGQVKCMPDTSKKPKLCLNVDKGNKGYRLVPGDVCKKDGTDVEKYIDSHNKCRNPSFFIQDESLSKKKSGSSVVAAVVVPLTILALAVSAYFAKKYWDIRKSKPTYQYSTLPQESAEHDLFDSSPQHHLTDDEDVTMIEV